MKWKDTSNLPRRATLVVKDYEVNEVEFGDGSKNRQLVLIGSVPETKTEEMKIKQTTEERKAMWLSPEATKENFGEVGTGSVAGRVMKQIGANSEKELVGKRVPLELMPGMKDGKPTRAEFYHIALR